MPDGLNKTGNAQYAKCLVRMSRTGMRRASIERMDFPFSRLATAVMTVGLAAASSACTVYARPAPPPPPAVAYEEPPPVEDGYEPQYYDGYVVYYDDVGRPYYYNGDRTVFVSPNVAIYGSLVGHWRVNRAAYGRWYAHRGPAYRGYRRGYRR